MRMIDFMNKNKGAVMSLVNNLVEENRMNEVIAICEALHIQEYRIDGKVIYKNA